MAIVDPWGSELVEDYEKLIKGFGLAHFNPDSLPNPNRLMRRQVTFASQDLNSIADAIKNKKPYYAMTGIMPTADKLHLGNKMVIETVKYFQDHGAKTYILIADLEALSTRGVSLEESKKRALNFHIPAYIALGLDPKRTLFYFQSDNKDVIKIANDAARRITLNEFRAVYGTAEPGRILAATNQVGDMVFPQLEQRMPGVIPVGFDQSPHLRLARDYIRRAKEKKFILLSSIYNKFTPSLDGGFKMSKSKPESVIELPEDINSVSKKIKKALTGGRDTLEEQRKLGAVIEKDMVFELLKQHLVEDDKELNKIYDDYKSGKMLSSEIKEIACEKMAKFMNDFSKKLEKSKKQVDKLKFIKWT